MTDRDNITLPREVVKLALEAFEAVMPFSTTQRELKIRAVEALRTYLAAPKQSKPKCGTCAFYEQDEDSTFRGACRFRLPSRLVTGVNSVQAAVDWCHLHKPKEGGT